MSVTCFFGKTKSGKSHRAKMELMKYKKRIIFDITESKTFKTEKKDGIDIKVDFECTDYSFKNLLKIFSEIIKKDSYTLVFRPSSERNFYDVGELVCSFAMRLGSYYGQDYKEEILLCLDELDKYVSISKQSFIARAIGMGRHSNLDLFCISQVPSQLPKVIKDNASKEFFFRLGFNKYYKDKLGDDLTKSLDEGKLPEFFCIFKEDSEKPVVLNKKSEKINIDGVLK